MIGNFSYYKDFWTDSDVRYIVGFNLGLFLVVNVVALYGRCCIICKSQDVLWLLIRGLYQYKFTVKLSGASRSNGEKSQERNLHIRN